MRRKILKALRFSQRRRSLKNRIAKNVPYLQNLLITELILLLEAFQQTELL
jgi:hypothetical protein